MGHLGLLLAAVALALACVTSAGADTVTVDLEYQTDTLTWALYATIVDTGSGNSGDHGLAALRALVDNVDFGTVTLAPDIGAIDPIDPGGPNERPAVLQTAGGTLDIIYGQNINNAPSVAGGVGVGGRALVMEGTFPVASTPPAFGNDDQSLTTDGNFLNVAAPGPFGRALPWDGVTLNVVNVTTADLSGDFNGNGSVDVADYVVWRNALGTAYEEEDYGVWRSNFGRTLTIAGAALPSFEPLPATVPEPTALYLVSIGLATIMWRRFVRQRRSPEADAGNSTILA